MPPAPQRKPRLDFIDWLRGAGILSVMLYHVTGLIFEDPIAWNGLFWDPLAYPPVFSAVNLFLQWWQAPSMFFVISGYLMHRALSRHAGEGLGRILTRRWVRLYVPYLIVLVLFAVIWPPTRIVNSGAGLVDGLLHLLLIFNFSDSTVWSINPSFWYIATELQLCMLYPVMLAIARRRGWRDTVLLLFAIEIAVRVVGSFAAWSRPEVPADLSATWMLRSAPAFVCTWALGAFVAEAHVQRTLKRPPLSLAIALPLLGLGLTVTHPLTGIAPLVMAVSIAVWIARLIVGAERREPSQRPLVERVNRGVRFVGSISLGAYLLNQPLIWEIVGRLHSHVPDPTMLLFVSVVASLLVVLPAAWVMLRVVEEPLARACFALIDRIRPPVAAPLASTPESEATRPVPPAG